MKDSGIINGLRHEILVAVVCGLTFAAGIPYVFQVIKGTDITNMQYYKRQKRR